MKLLQSEIFILTFTLIIFYFFRWLQQRYRKAYLSPAPLTMIVVIIFLQLTNITYETYYHNVHILHFLLGPSVVALAYPLYLQIQEVKKSKKLILLSVGCGSLAGIITGAGGAFLFGASKEVIKALSAKSVTTPIAIDLVGAIGGNVPLITALLAAVGVFGAVFGVSILKLFHITSPKAVGLAMGTAAHGLGTARASEEGDEQGAYSGLAMALCGVFTAILIPLFDKIFF